MSTGKPRPEARLWLHKADQATAAAVLVVALAAMAGFWLWTSFTGPGVIDIETAPPLAADFKIDLNQADWPELAMLPNVGEALAKRIVEYRTAHGAFRRVEELRYVKGIGPKTFAEVTPYLLAIEEPPAAAGN